MSKKAFIVILAMAVVMASGAISIAAEQKAAALGSPAKPAVMSTTAATRTPVKPNFGMVAGSIVAIDSADPANVKLSVKNDADGSVRTIFVTPWTNITKVTDVSELKTGEPVRMMTRKVDDKDVAMGIMFGKMKSMPPIAPKAPVAPQAPAVNVKK